MRKVIIVLLCTHVVCVISEAQNSIPDCKKIDSCHTGTGGNGNCSVTIEYTHCSSGTITLVSQGCFDCGDNTCSCNCSGSSPNFTGYAIGYEDCQGIVHVDAY